MVEKPTAKKRYCTAAKGILCRFMAEGVALTAPGGGYHMRSTLNRLRAPNPTVGK
jgi:hypothetical protein